MLLLDTDVVVDLLRDYPPALAWLESLGDVEVLLPGFVVMEVIQGCRNKAEQEQVEKEMEGFFVLWPSPAMCGTALSVFTYYHLSTPHRPPKRTPLCKNNRLRTTMMIVSEQCLFSSINCSTP